MERAAATGLRSCLRIRTTGSCIGIKSLKSQGCIASFICPARSVTSATNSPSGRPSAMSTTYSHDAPRRVIRNFSTPSSSIQGTIGSGASSMKDEAARAIESLIAPDHLDEKERQIWNKLIVELEPTELHVQDISGGCGSMYGIEIVSEKFRGLNMLKQQRLVNQVLGEDIKQWHGVQLKTKAP